MTRSNDTARSVRVLTPTEEPLARYRIGIMHLPAMWLGSARRGGRGSDRWPGGPGRSVLWSPGGVVAHFFFFPWSACRLVRW